MFNLNAIYSVKFDWRILVSMEPIIAKGIHQKSPESYLKFFSRCKYQICNIFQMTLCFHSYKFLNICHFGLHTHTWLKTFNKSCLLTERGARFPHCAPFPLNGPDFNRHVNLQLS